MQWYKVAGEQAEAGVINHHMSLQSQRTGHIPGECRPTAQTQQHRRKSALLSPLAPSCGESPIACLRTRAAPPPLCCGSVE
ncbi:hypothetical protein J6590_017978 [Homalodisca vitripennis]|nr:hypothetical protein J6590_017978 [Homalodisca vitripennis]